MFESWPEMCGGGYPAYRTTLRKFLWFRTVTGGNAPEFKTVTGNIVDFVTQRIAPLKIEATLEPIQSGTGDPSPDNVRPISGHSGADIYVEDEYDAQADPTVQISFGSTVYGGKLTVNEDGSGTVVADMVMKSFTGSENFMTNSAWGEHTFLYDYGISMQSSYNTRDRVLSSHFKVQNAAGWINLTENHFMIGSTQYIGLWFDGTKTELQTWLTAQVTAGKPVQVLGVLNTPVTIALTPGQVNALLGNNTVWVDSSDNISVTYQSN